MSTNSNPSSQSVRDDVGHWFFNDYLPTWVGVGAGTVARGPDFILDYWEVPLHFSDGTSAEWLLDAAAVIGRLHGIQEHPKLNRYTPHQLAGPTGRCLQQYRRGYRSDLVALR